MRKTHRFQVRTTVRFVSRLETTCRLLEKDRSDLVREATNEKIDALAEANPKLRAALKKIEQAAEPSLA